MDHPLQGIRVIDSSRALAGPYCTEMLADMGADVIKIERPGKGDDSRHWGPPFHGTESAYFLSINRNKRSITLNLADPDGADIYRRLVAVSDVVVENMRPGGMARLGLDYDDLALLNPRLVWCSITGFGTTGPDARRPGYDIIAQGMGGMMSITGEPDRPIRPGVALADITTGMFAAYGIATALFERERSGKGQRVDTSLFEGQIALMTYQAGSYFATGRPPGRIGNSHPSIAPYDTIRVKDGIMNIAVGNDSLWTKFCQALELSELHDNPDFASNPLRVKHRRELIEAIEKVTTTLDSMEIGRRLDQAGVPNGPVWNLSEVLEAPQTAARAMVETCHHPTAGPIRVTGIPLKMSRTPGSIRRPPPTLGQHTDEILTETLGLNAEEIANLRTKNIL